MNTSKTSNGRWLITLMGFVSLLACANDEAANTGWATLDPTGSSLSFVSVKNKDIAEAHVFERLSGSISTDGGVAILVDVASVNTGIEIRDQRMKEHLFNLAEYSEIRIDAQVDINILTEGVQNLQIPATLSLVGREVAVQLDVLANKSADDLIVSSAKPVILNADALGLSAGINTLAELAGGIAIGYSVPVSFSLRFEF